MEAHVSYRGSSHLYALPIESPVSALKAVIHENLDLPPSQQKLLAKGKLLRDDDAVPAHDKIMVLGSSAASISAVQESLTLQAQKSRARQGALKAAPGINRSSRVNDIHAVSYTFHSISPLPLPGSTQAQSLLLKLSRDAAIVALMKRHKLVVGHLTELDPRTNTSHSGKLLGLNKNGGAEILLRLRTDDMDGFRDYRGIRSTLVHELTHNTYGDHDAKFWDLFKMYSKEVAEHEAGRTLGMNEVFIPEDGKSVDHGVEWVGGGGVLGSSTPSQQDLSAREQRARAAEARNQRTS